jgi:ATP-dependent protease ClpP protease subunit
MLEMIMETTIPFSEICPDDFTRGLLARGLRSMAAPAFDDPAALSEFVSHRLHVLQADGIEAESVDGLRGSLRLERAIHDASLRVGGCAALPSIDIVGTIDEAMDFRLRPRLEAIHASGASGVVVRIASTGGTVDTANHIRNKLTANGRKMICVCGPASIAFSAGADLMFSGAWAIAHKTARMMIHGTRRQTSSGCITQAEAAAAQSSLNERNEDAAELMVRRSLPAFIRTAKSLGDLEINHLVRALDGYFESENQDLLTQAQSVLELTAELRPKLDPIFRWNGPLMDGWKTFCDMVPKGYSDAIRDVDQSLLNLRLISRISEGQPPGDLKLIEFAAILMRLMHTRAKDTYITSSEALTLGLVDEVIDVG